MEIVKEIDKVTKVSKATMKRDNELIVNKVNIGAKEQNHDNA